MSKINAMTWNTSLYRENSSQPNMLKYNAAVKFIKDFMCKENPVVFLQEIPFCSNEDWREHSLYISLKEDFPENEYDLLFNVSRNTQIMMTIAIAKKGSLQIVDCDSNDNRTITVSFKEMHFTGVHAKNGAENKSYLDALLTCNSDIILGDFNAGDYKAAKNRIAFNALCENYIDICDEGTTSRNRAIDHVLVRKDSSLECTDLSIHRDVTVSDHYPITFFIRHRDSVL